VSDRKEELEGKGPIRVEVGSDGSYGIGWEAAAWPGGKILVTDDSVWSEVTMHVTLGECVIEETECTKLHILVSCDGSLSTVVQNKPAAAFRDIQHSMEWTDYMIAYLNSHLHQRLRLIASLTVEEAIAKASEIHGIAKTDWKKLAGAHAKILAEKIKRCVGVSSGRERLFKTKQEYVDFLADAARACRSAGARFTQKFVADFGSEKFTNERAIDERTVRQWNKEYKVNWKYWSDKVNRRN
jgi:hypothetical protein